MASSSSSPTKVAKDGVQNLMEKFNRKQDKPNGPTYPELFDNEDQSDVTFLVGRDGWRFPGHKHVLAPASPVFRAMLNGPLSSRATKEEIQIEDLEPRAFENILRFIYMSEVKLVSIQAALDTLYATDKYMLPALTRLCLEVLEFSLTVSNVLEIHQGIRLYCSVYRSPNNQDGGVQETDQSTSYCQDKGKDTPQDYIALLHTLQNRCLELIDCHAEQIFTCEEFADLSHAEVGEIVFRDTLQVKSEASVFEALHRYAIQQCKRNQKAMTWENKKDCLTSTVYGARYLLMTREEFLAGPGSTELLDKSERDWLLAAIDGRTNQPAPPQLANFVPYMQRRRGQRPRSAIVTSKDDRQEVHQTTSKETSLLKDGVTTTSKLQVDPWCDTQKKGKNKKQCCCEECFGCFSLFFD